MNCFRFRKDAYDETGFVSYLALIYTWLGERDLALDQLAIAAKAPNGITYGELKLNPTWDSAFEVRSALPNVASLAPNAPPIKK